MNVLNDALKSIVNAERYFYVYMLQTRKKASVIETLFKDRDQVLESDAIKGLHRRVRGR